MSAGHGKVRIHYIHHLSQRSRERLAGLFVLLALAILVGLIFVNSRTTHFFEKKIYYHAFLKNAQGISTESVVNLSGIEVGRVSAIDISPDHRIDITLFVYERYRDLLRTDSRAALSKLSVLGKAAIDISAGSPDKPLLEAGATLPIDEPLSIDELIAKVSPVVDQLKQIVDSTASITAAIDPDDVRSMSHDLAVTAKNLRSITSQLASGKGAAGKALYNKEMEQQLVNSMKSLEAALAKADQRLEEMGPVVQGASGLGSELKELAGEARQLVKQMNTAMGSVNVELQQLPELVNRMQILLDETNRTIEGMQNIWPISTSLPKESDQTVIEAQPAK
jgi:phospholipid/cholesterol/gamma-HCH transport system substrate-binding protein